MANWTFDPTQYKEKSFSIIPVGDYRLQIVDVVEKKFSSGNEGYEITLGVNGYSSKIWYYLVLDPSDPAKTNQRIGEFFNSFGITSPAMGNGKQWISLIGAGRIKHELYNGEQRPRLAYFINRDRQENLAPWAGNATAAAPAPAASTVELPTDLPFDLT